MKRGSQKPTFSAVGGYAYSNGAEVANMFEEEGGATFYPTQREELTLMLARNDDGSPAALTIGISKPRQNGKSYAARYYAAYMADFEHRDVLFSAHHSKTTHQMFQALCDLFESPNRYPEFAADVKKISKAKGFEGIYFNDWMDENGRGHKGGCIEFSTRTNSGARGGTYSVIIIDEAQELTFEQQEAMLPTISAASDASDRSRLPQQIYLGTPPGPACRGTVFQKMHDTAHTSGGGTWWLEWAIEAGAINQSTVNRANVLELAYKCNPAMGYRMTEDVVLSEFEQMSLDGFARERLGWWSPVITQTIDYALDHNAWLKCVSEETKPTGKTAYGVKFSADGSSVCLCGAVIPSKGTARVSLIKEESTGKGVKWLSDWLNERYKEASCVVVDGRNGVDLLVEQIAPIWKAKDSVIRPTAKDVIAAASALSDAVNTQTVTWYKYQERLNESATTAIKRPISGGWGFGGENSPPIEACALALWGAKTSKRNPQKRMRIG